MVIEKCWSSLVVTCLKSVVFSERVAGKGSLLEIFGLSEWYNVTVKFVV